MHRREFVSRIPGVTAGLACAGAVVSLGGCAGAPYVVPRSVGPTLVVKLAELSRQGAFVENPGSSRPIFAGWIEGEWVAVHARCTHRGCQPEPVLDRLVCPCHGSEFTFKGTVLEGPAERPLRQYEARVAGDELVIHLDRGVGG